jgi:hypothetical protein
MDDDNIDIEDVQQVQAQAAQDEQQQQQQQQQQAVVLLKKMILVLEQKETFPLQTRNKTDELVENFLEELGNDVHTMLCSGLDSDRDTEAQVEAIVRVFPGVLTRRHMAQYPIELLAFARNEDRVWQCNVKAVSFIPTFARIATEFDLFTEELRGGLLCEDNDGDNILQHLVLSSNLSLGRDHNRIVDETFLKVLTQLRKLGLLKKQDIQRYSLLRNLCREDHFAEKRFRFLVEWDPSTLLHPDQIGELPLHHVIVSPIMQGFQMTFEAGIKYFPKKKGICLLFKENNHGKYTPFQYACGHFGHEKVMEVVEDTLAHYSSSSDDTPPLHVVNALMTAAIDENIHLDCVYFLLRRQPDILQKLLSSASITMIDPNPMVVFNSNNNGISPKKRKRKEHAQTELRRSTRLGIIYDS